MNPKQAIRKWHQTSSKNQTDTESKNLCMKENIEERPKND